MIVNHSVGFPFENLQRLWYTHRRELVELVTGGLGMHHAGMLRSDRNLVERLFRDGVIKV